jgi:predicted outer membrane protein
MLSQHIAVCLTLGNQEEVALGQFAQERAQNPQVKQFAQMMAQEHQQAISQLQQASPQLASMNLELSAQGGGSAARGQGSATSARGAGSSSSAGSATSGAPSGSGSGASGATGSGSGTGASGQATAGSGASGSASGSASQRTSASGAQGGGQTQQVAQFEQQVKQQCLNLTMTELGRKQGAEFDKAYIGQQLVAHTQMLAQLQAAQQHASSELQPIIQQGTQMTEHHLAQARQIMEQLDAGGAGGQGQGQQPGAPPTPRS